MKISKKYRKMLVDEIKFARKKMRGEKNFNNKCFYYSAVFGIISRIINFEYDSQLLLMHHATQTTYTVINNRINRMGTGDLTVILDEEFFYQLEEILDELEKAIKQEKDDKLYKIFEKLICLSYISTGNGYYLSLKGVKLVPEN